MDTQSADERVCGGSGLREEVKVELQLNVPQVLLLFIYGDALFRARQACLLCELVVMVTWPGLPVAVASEGTPALEVGGTWRQGARPGEEVWSATYIH